MGKRKANGSSSISTDSQPVDEESESPRKSSRLSRRSKEYEEMLINIQKRRRTSSAVMEETNSDQEEPPQPGLLIESPIKVPKKRGRKPKNLIEQVKKSSSIRLTSPVRSSTIDCQPSSLTKSPRTLRRTTNLNQEEEEEEEKSGQSFPHRTVADCHETVQSSSTKSARKRSPIKSPVKSKEVVSVHSPPIVQQSKRGRPKKLGKDNEVNARKSGTMLGMENLNPKKRKESKVRSFQCSACQTVFDVESKAKRHLHSEHYGLAYLNEPHPSMFTDAERVKAYTNTLKVVSYIDCRKCGKRFRSGLGLKLHEDICGKSDDERNVSCEICDKVLKESSMRSHAKTHLLKDNLEERVQFVPTSSAVESIDSIQNNDNKLINLDGPVFDTSIGGTRPVRSSARKAMQLFAQTNRESDDDDEEEEQGEHWSEDGQSKSKKARKSLANGKQRVSSKLDYDLFSEDSMVESESDEEDEESEDKSANGSEGEGKENEAEDNRFYDYSREIEQIAAMQAEEDGDDDDQLIQLFNRWRDYFETFYDKQRKWPSEDEELDQFLNDCKYYGFLRCPHKCKQLFETEQSLKQHYIHCGFVASCKCKFCEETGTEKRTLLLHLFRTHLDRLPRIEMKKLLPKASSRSSKTGLRPITMSKFLTDASYDFGEFASKHYSDPVLVGEDWMPKIDHFKKIQNSKMNSFLPQHRQSPSFRCLKRTRVLLKSTIETQDWKRLDLFEHHIENNHITIFTGGPVYAGAWCPLPAKVKETTATGQVLCLATVSERAENLYNSNKAVGHRGLLQFWSFDQLDHDKGEPTSEPRLSFAIAHDFGIIWDMAWCPGGTSFHEQSKEDGRLSKQNKSNVAWSRLGLLAVACGDGNIRILSIPFENDLQRNFGTQSKNSTLPTIVHCRPVAILKSPKRCPSLLDWDVICRCLSWCRTDSQRKIVAGYGNGLIAVFDLATKSPLLLSIDNGMNVLQAQRCWIGHGAIVNSVKWLPYENCEYLLSGSFDRCLKLWDLKNLSMAVNLQKRGIVTKVEYATRWCGAYFAHDDCYLNLHNNVLFKGLTPEAMSNSLSKHKGCVWDFNTSDWINIEASVDFSGEAVMHLGFLPNGRHKARRRNKGPDLCYLPLYHIGCDLLDTETTDHAESSSKSKSSATDSKSQPYLIARNQPLVRTYESFTNSYGLTFYDIDLTDQPKLPINELNRVRFLENMNYARLGDFPLVSLNKVEWNPNKSKSEWLFTSGESGLTRISVVPLISKRTK